MVGLGFEDTPSFLGWLRETVQRGTSARLLPRFYHQKHTEVVRERHADGRQRLVEDAHRPSPSQRLFQEDMVDDGAASSRAVGAAAVPLEVGGAEAQVQKRDQERVTQGRVEVPQQDRWRGARLPDAPDDRINLPALQVALGSSSQSFAWCREMGAEHVDPVTECHVQQASSDPPRREGLCSYTEGSLPRQHDEPQSAIIGVTRADATRSTGPQGIAPGGVFGVLADAAGAGGAQVGDDASAASQRASGEIVGSRAVGAKTRVDEGCFAGAASQGLPLGLGFADGDGVLGLEGLQARPVSLGPKLLQADDVSVERSERLDEIPGALGALRDGRRQACIEGGYGKRLASLPR